MLKRVDYPNAFVKSTSVQFMLLNNDQLYGIGTNTNGQLAQGDYDERKEFVEVPMAFTGLDDDNLPVEEKVLKYLSNGGLWVLTQGKRMYGVGNPSTFGLSGSQKINTLNIAGKLPFANVKDIFYNSTKMFLLLESGDLYVKGKQTMGEMGLGVQTGTYNSFTKTADGLNVKDVITGSNTATYLYDGEKIYRCGQVWSSQISYSTRFGQVPIPETVVDYKINGSSGVAKGVSGQFYAWGANSNGQLALGHTTFTQTPELLTIPNNETVKEFDIGYILTEEGNLYVSGNNAWGVDTSLSGPHFARVDINEPVAKIFKAMGSSVPCFAQTISGKVYAWGYNDYGRLGLNSTISNTRTPLPIADFPAGETVTDIYAFGSYTIFVINNRKVYFSGGNRSSLSGVPGDVTSTNYYRAILVDTLSEDIEVIFADLGGMYITTANKLYFWGSNSSSRFGLPNPVVKPTEITIGGSTPSPSSVTMVSEDYAILYPNGGTPDSPANVEINERYLEENPFAGYFINCSAEVLYNGKWGETGFMYSDNFDRGGGVKAKQLLPDDKIILQTGDMYVLGASKNTGNPLNVYPYQEEMMLPCRVKIQRLARIPQ